MKVTIPEGYTVLDIASTLEKKNVCSAKDFLKACSTTEGYDYDWLADFPKNDPNVGYILEGFLFPATYDFGENSKATDIADAMLEAFDHRITDEVKTYCKQPLRPPGLYPVLYCAKEYRAIQSLAILPLLWRTGWTRA